MVSLRFNVRLSIWVFFLAFDVWLWLGLVLGLDFWLGLSLDLKLGIVLPLGLWLGVDLGLELGLGLE